MNLALSKRQLAVLGVILLAAGCGCCPKEIVVTKVPLNARAVNVHFVGVSDYRYNSEGSDWDRITMGEYFATTDPSGCKLRSSAKNVTIPIESTNGLTGARFRLNKTVPMWRTWKKDKVLYIYVMALAGDNYDVKALRLPGPEQCKCLRPNEPFEVEISTNGINLSEKTWQNLKKKCRDQVRPGT